MLSWAEPDSGDKFAFYFLDEATCAAVCGTISLIDLAFLPWDGVSEIQNLEPLPVFLVLFGVGFDAPVWDWGLRERWSARKILLVITTVCFAPIDQFKCSCLVGVRVSEVKQLDEVLEREQGGGVAGSGGTPRFWRGAKIVLGNAQSFYVRYDPSLVDSGAAIERVARRLLGSSLELRAHALKLRLRKHWKDDKWIVLQKDSIRCFGGSFRGQPECENFGSKLDKHMQKP
ncbi:hypothetical protein ABZP36_010927 [Zizania latifolia]